MKPFIVVVFGLLLVTPVFGQHHFRKTAWGMTSAQVRAAEPSQFHGQKGDVLLFDVELFDARCLVSYSFVDDKLFRAGYVTDEYFMNEALYFDMYEKLRDAVAGKYGPPKQEVRYVPDAYKDDPGTGLVKGIVFYYAYWDLGDVEILLSVEGGDAAAHVSVEYTNKELKLEAERKARGNLDDQF